MMMMHHTECQYVYTDRPTHLLQSRLRSLEALASHDGTESDYDALPSLVFQLGSLPMGVVSSRGGGATAGGVVAPVVAPLTVNTGSTGATSRRQRPFRYARPSNWPWGCRWRRPCRV